MEPSQRAARSLVRLVAFCCIIIGLLDAGLYFTEWLKPHGRPPLNILRLVLDSIPIVIGIVIFIKTKALAEWLEDLLQ